MGETSATLRICGRLYLLLLTTAAIVSSLFLVFSCQFFSYRTIDGEVWSGFHAPFDALPTASVGLFRYSETTTTDENIIFGDSCLGYPSWENAGHNSYFLVAQWCSIIAPVVALMAWFILFVDMIYCRFCGSFAVVSFLFFSAGALQGCTFLVFADTQFCFEAESVNKCALKSGSWFSLGSMVAYLILSLVTPAVPISPHEEKVGCGCCIVTRERRSKKDEEGNWQVDDENTTVNGGSAGDEEKGEEEEKTEEEGYWTSNIMDSLCGQGQQTEDSVEVEAVKSNDEDEIKDVASSSKL